MARIGYLERCAGATGGHQLGVRLGGVPAVGVAGPFPLLPDQQARFDSLARRFERVFKSVEAEGLNQDRSVGERPRAPGIGLGLLFDSLQARQGGEALARRSIGPLGRVHIERKRGRVRLVGGD